jgi:heptaprenyl diphosphate synthase
MSPTRSGTPLGLTLADEELEARLAAGLVDVEVRLRVSATSDDPFVTEVARHLVDAGGKRFRPLLVLLAAEFGDATSPSVVPAGVVVELIHLATLYHDDVMDEAALRRGADSANVRWGNTVAILTGDFLFARGSGILAELGPEAVRIQAETFERLCVGQIRETVGPQPGQDAVGHHLAVLADKTGSLIATSCRYGALMSGCDRDTVARLTTFGERIGVAFQLADDVVDITSEATQSGKTPGTDLREGVPTLAGLVALASTDPADARLHDLLSRPLPDDGEHAEALALLRDHAGVEQAREQARQWADGARAALAPLPDIAARRALEQLCDYVVTRTG